MRKFIILSFLSYLSLNCFGFAELINKLNNMNFEEVSDCEFIKMNPNSSNFDSSNFDEFLALSEEFAKKDEGASKRASRRRTVKDPSRSLTYEISKGSFKFLKLPKKAGLMTFLESKEEGGKPKIHVQFVEGFAVMRNHTSYEPKKRRFSGVDPVHSYLIVEKEDGTAQRIHLYSFDPETDKGVEEIPLKQWREDYKKSSKRL